MSAAATLAVLAGASMGPLAVFEPWLDRCWSATIALETRDTHCFTRVFGGAHVRDRHRVTKGGKTVYEGETLYSAEGEEVTFLYVSSIGGIGRGKAVAVPGGIDFEMAMRPAPKEAAKSLPAQWRWTGPQSYGFHNGGGPEIAFTLDTAETRKLAR
jgi:hypothetical protein